jgi:hypothetical protein
MNRQAYLQAKLDEGRCSTSDPVQYAAIREHPWAITRVRSIPTGANGASGTQQTSCPTGAA